MAQLRCLICGDEIERQDWGEAVAFTEDDRAIHGDCIGDAECDRCGAPIVVEAEALLFVRRPFRAQISAQTAGDERAELIVHERCTHPGDRVIMEYQQ